MQRSAREALRIIRRCLASQRVRVLPHFTQRMHQRGMVWADMLSIFEAPHDVRSDGMDDWARSRWLITGRGADGLAVPVVCVIGQDDDGKLTVFVTLFRET